MDYINEKIISKIKSKEENIKRKEIGIEDLYLLPATIKLNQSSQLYNEMLDLISENHISYRRRCISKRYSNYISYKQ